jgi:hypothetical protein
MGRLPTIGWLMKLYYFKLFGFSLTFIVLASPFNFIMEMVDSTGGIWNLVWMVLDNRLILSLYSFYLLIIYVIILYNIIYIISIVLYLYRCFKYFSYSFIWISFLIDDYVCKSLPIIWEFSFAISKACFFLKLKFNDLTDVAEPARDSLISNPDGEL